MGWQGKELGAFRPSLSLSPLPRTRIAQVNFQNPPTILLTILQYTVVNTKQRHEPAAVCSCGDSWWAAKWSSKCFHILKDIRPKKSLASTTERAGCVIDTATDNNSENKCPTALLTTSLPTAGMPELRHLNHTLMAAGRVGVGAVQCMRPLPQAPRPPSPPGEGGRGAPGPDRPG